MSQPQWITPAGSLGTIQENLFFKFEVKAQVVGSIVFYRLLAGRLPDGIQVTLGGVLEGMPRNSISVQGVPLNVTEDVTSKFTLRAYTTKIVDGVEVIDRVADRTFSITVTGQNIPEFLTPPGNIGKFYDGTVAETQVRFTDQDLDDNVIIRLLSGELPPGLSINQKTGVISGVIRPLLDLPGTVTPGWEMNAWEDQPWDVTAQSINKNYQFTLEITDGKDSNVRTFEIFVYSKNTMRASTTQNEASDTFITADVTPDRPPILLTPAGDLGQVRSDNWYAFKFDSIDFDGQTVEFVITTGSGLDFDQEPYDAEAYDRGFLSLPPGLELDANTGWLYGYIPDQGATEQTYRFAVRVRNKQELGPPWDSSLSYTAESVVRFGINNYVAVQNVVPGVLPTNDLYWQIQETPISNYRYFTITIIGQNDLDVFWITPGEIGTINNGAISNFSVEAFNLGNRVLQYRLVPGSNSKLPQGLTLLTSGHIAGQVSFNTFALDKGTTTFDKNPRTRLIAKETTIDMVYKFTVNAFSSISKQIGYEVAGITVIDGGAGYTSIPVVTISPPPPVDNAIQATAGAVTIVNGVITNIDVGNPGRGYTAPPTITITGGGGVGGNAVINTRINTLAVPVSTTKTFSITVNRAYNIPYQSLYIKCMPPVNDRTLINQLIQNQDIIPSSLLYRNDDPNFGTTPSVQFQHAVGIVPSSLDEYVQSLRLNHYWKNLVLGNVRTAQALDSQGNVIYEVVYCPIIDNLVNNQGVSVSKQVELPYTVMVNSAPVTEVYPNSLINMRDQVFESLGQIPPELPQWMVSKQKNGTVLGFIPAWVIAYTKPDQADRIAFNIRNQFAGQLKNINFEVDRYIIDRSQTYNWDTSTDQWIPAPAEATTFDRTLTVVDGGSIRFIVPSNRSDVGDRFDKYIVFPKQNILG